MKNPAARPPRPTGRHYLRVSYSCPGPMPVRVLNMEERRLQRDSLDSVISGIERQTVQWRTQPALMLSPLLPTRVERELLPPVERFVIEDVFETEHEV
jgi:hypothetical protein